MKTWLIEPRDPVIFGDGKPFSEVPGGRTQSMAFPFPSVIAGGVRNNAGSDASSGHFDESRIDELLAKQVRGPVLVEVDYTSGQPVVNDKWLLPAPADAMLLEDDNESGDSNNSKQAQRFSLRPLELPNGTSANLEGDLELVGTPKKLEQKPLTQAPRYWRWDAYAAWLQSPTDGPVSLPDLGHSGPTPELRTHVRIDPETFSTLEGDLFQTGGLEFLNITKRQAENGDSTDGQPQQLTNARPLALAIQTDAKCNEWAAPLGGERRIVQWRRLHEGLPECPAQVRAAILAKKACRMILATPAYFEEGYLPTWLLNTTPELTVTVQAVATRRYQVVSGWDYVTNKPKPTRRLVPMGAVYFLKLDGTEGAIEAFIDSVWMRSVSDGEQDRRDGFGLATVGTWDGTLCPLEMEEK